MFEPTMVERVARVICRAAGDDPDVEAKDAQDASNDGMLRWEMWTDEASAALEASGHAEMVEALNEARLQIEYLHEEFAETGSGNTALAKIRSALNKACPAKEE